MSVASFNRQIRQEVLKGFLRRCLVGMQLLQLRLQVVHFLFLVFERLQILLKNRYRHVSQLGNRLYQTGGIQISMISN